VVAAWLEAAAARQGAQAQQGGAGGASSARRQLLALPRPPTSASDLGALSRWLSSCGLALDDAAKRHIPFSAHRRRCRHLLHQKATDTTTACSL
jgi:hypothetical protein